MRQHQAPSRLTSSPNPETHSGTAAFTLRNVGVQLFGKKDLCRTNTQRYTYLVHLGAPKNFLRIRPTLIDGSFLIVTIEAVATAPGCRFSALNDNVVIADSSETTMQKFADFADLKMAEFELRISAGGWLRFKRNLRGALTVRYRIGGPGDLSMEGEVIVEGEYTHQLYSHISAWLRNKISDVTDAG